MPETSARRPAFLLFPNAGNCESDPPKGISDPPKGSHPPKGLAHDSKPQRFAPTQRIPWGGSSIHPKDSFGWMSHPPKGFWCDFAFRARRSGPLFSFFPVECKNVIISIHPKEFPIHPKEFCLRPLAPSPKARSPPTKPIHPKEPYYAQPPSNQAPSQQGLALQTTVFLFRSSPDKAAQTPPPSQPHGRCIHAQPRSQTNDLGSMDRTASGLQTNRMRATRNGSTHPIVISICL